MEVTSIVAGVREVFNIANGFEGSVRLDFGADGIVHICAGQIEMADKPADCTIKLSRHDFMLMTQGKLDPVMAFLQKKLNIEGDVSVAMHLSKMFRTL